MKPLRWLPYAAIVTGVVMLAGAPSNIAVAQGNLTAKNVIPESAGVSLIATIKSIDPATREVALEGQSGATVRLTAGPAVRLDLLKVGDVVNAKYYRSVGFLVSPPQENGQTPVPDASMTEVLARPAQAPGGIGLRLTKISGIVVGLDLAAHTIDLTSAGGGPVYTVEVTDPARIAALSQMQIGDIITAVVSEALAVQIKPARNGSK